MNKVECSLDCNHSVRISVHSNPMVGDSKYCRLDGWQTIREIFWAEYRVVCCHCIFGRWCGQSHARAKRHATQHEHARTGHVAVIVSDIVTKSGGTPRQKIVADIMKELRAQTIPDKVDSFTAPMPPPF